MIEIANLHKAYGKKEVLKGIDLSIVTPGITAVLGPNASGKTTLIKCVLGMVIPDSGAISINGQNIKGQWQFRDQIDYLPQIARFPENLRVSELLDMIKSLRPRQSSDKKLIDFLGIGEALEQKLGHLSGGTRQKVNLVAALMYDSPIIILDEPSVGLDPIALIRMKQLINRERDKGKIILITTHIMQLVEDLADNVVFLLDGKIYFNDTIDELRSRYPAPDVEASIASLLEEGSMIAV